MSNNIYVSFSAENSDKDAWVSELMNFFKITLGKISPIPININSALNPGIDLESQIDKTKIIILIFNGFVSDSFARDLRILELRHHELVLGGKEIFVVNKSERFSSIIPIYLRKYSQYNFFEINIRTNEAIDYSPFFKGEKENKFWSKLTDLAYDTKMFFEPAEGSNDEDKKLVVYLAEVSRDQVSNREILKREFLLSGYKVLPAKPLPTSIKEYHDTAMEIIINADVSIHIMGEVYGESPSGTDYSYPELQNKLVTELLGKTEILKKNFYRFVWLPPSLEPYDEKQVQYLKRLKKELSESKSGEIIQCSIEEFKELFVQKINQIAGSDLQSIISKKEKNIVVITDNAEQLIFSKIEDQLRAAHKNFDVIDLSKTGDLFPLAMFRQKLKMANGAILLNLIHDSLWIQGMLGLTVKYFRNGNKSSIVVVTSLQNKAAIDFNALKVDFLALDDSQLIKNIDKFLIQLS